MSNYQVLVVEDDEDIIHVYQDILDMIDDIEVTILENGNRAVELVDQKRFDCMLLDIKVPGLTGLQIASHVREGKTNRTTPIYIVSGSLDATNLAISQTFGVVEAIKKPFDIKELKTKVSNTLKSRRTLYKYDSRIINLFISSAKEVFEHYFGEKILAGRPKIKPNGHPARGYVTGIISITGSGFTGSMAASCNGAFAKRLIDGLFKDSGGAEATVEVAIDAMGEIANQIAGRVKIAFSKSGQKVVIGLPQVVSGKGHTLYHTSKNPVLFIPMGLEKMGCDVEFCFSQTDIEMKDEADVEPTGDLESGMLLFD